MSLPPPPEPEDQSNGDLSAARTVSVSSGKSAANGSEFSLSILPDPPPVERSSVFSDPLPMVRAKDPPFGNPRARAGRQSRIPRSALSGEGLSVPGSPAEHTRFNSAGTQYDVTSFIGDLTTPGPTSEPKMSALGEVAETESDIESPVISTATPGSAATLRPLLLNSAAPSITSLPPATASSGVLTSNSSQPTTYEYPILKPLLLGSAAPAVSSPLSGGARRTPGPSVFSGPRRPARSGQGLGRPVISGPRQLEDEQAEEAEAFERPRKPPAVNLQE